MKMTFQLLGRTLLGILLLFLAGFHFAKSASEPGNDGLDRFRTECLRNGLILLYKNDTEIGAIQPQIFGEKWELYPFVTTNQDPRFLAQAKIKDQGSVGLLAFVAVTQNDVRVHYQMTAMQDLKVIDARAVLFMPAKNWDQAPWAWDKASGDISLAEENNGKILVEGQGAATFGPSPQDGLRVVWNGDGLHGILQDNRKWTPHLLLSWDHHEPGDHTWLWKEGETKDFDFTVTLNRDFYQPPTAQLKGNDFAGTWCGLAEDEKTHQKYRVAFEFLKNAKGKWVSFFNSLEVGVFNQKLTQVTAPDPSSFHVILDEKNGTLDLKLDPTGQEVIGESQFATGQRFKVRLHRGNEYLLPRVDALGQPVTQYTYQVPHTMEDGWPVGDLRQSPFDVTTVEHGVKEILNGTFPNIESLVLIHKGRVILDEYFKGMTAADEHSLQSVTKSVLSTLFGIARDQGLVDEHEKLFDYFSDYGSKPGWVAEKGQITLADVLSMTSGFDCDDWVGEENSCGHQMWPSPDWLSYVLTLRLANKPGTHFSYCTSCLEPLGAILARKSGLSITDFAQAYLYDPLGIRAQHWWVGPNDVTEVGGSHWLRPRDMAKLGQLYLNKGKWNGKQVVSEKWVELATQPQAPNPKDHPRSFEYGYLWWQEEMPFKDRTTHVFYAAGKGGQYILVAPELEIVFVVTAGNYGTVSYTNLGIDLFKNYILPAYR